MGGGGLVLTEGGGWGGRTSVQSCATIHAKPVSVLKFALNNRCACLEKRGEHLRDALKFQNGG